MSNTSYSWLISAPERPHSIYVRKGRAVLLGSCALCFGEDKLDWETYVVLSPYALKGILKLINDKCRDTTRK